MNKQELIKNLKDFRDSYPDNDRHKGIRQGLLIAIGAIENLEEPEKVVIPKFVADWWERDADSVTMYGGESINKKYKLRLISNFYVRGLGDHLSKVEDWLDENDSTFLDLVNGKPYEVEKEKKYYVYDKSTKGYLGYNADKTRLSWYTSKFPNSVFTEQEIREIDERFWPFAVEVAE